ncbi:MAG: BrnT family toxin [Deltaproteobacteria bacterium]|nr:BrnT family toxin [Deltaproteobacteria bacterium]
MKQLEFSWDTEKDKANLKKHGISFKEAQTVFHDENARLIDDPDHSEEKEPFILLVLSSTLRILTVCHCYRSEDTVIRIISARKATKKERKHYEERLS